MCRSSATVSIRECRRQASRMTSTRPPLGSLLKAAMLTASCQILRDKIVFGVNDAKVKERLLQKAKLALNETDEICQVAKSM